MGRDVALEQRWRNCIDECRQSGLTAKQWCLQNGLNITLIVTGIKSLIEWHNKRQKIIHSPKWFFCPKANSALTKHGPQNRKFLYALEIILSVYRMISIQLPIVELVKVLQKL
ncbi:hypothetical protein [Desulfosporosinus sp. FKB]|uniref:IS66 family insertion sequence element accessory protein TnpA n=1 Tax=Desulfosporosinus sp. FKB TaxID=1969835 RepID=UPI000B4A021E|nr:hypothetical protein [Desulfosporosinus sp. FKB]